ncbi:MAG: hypothetical protein HQL47_11890, partial [Gammaproteobacteria bacterium]|nr:hypothetical protein [Gammaproteobacteria bacterium]
MRRLGLSQKVFLVFSSLTLLTFVVAIIVFIGFRGIKYNNASMLLLENLQQNIHGLTHRHPQQPDADRQAFTTELSQTRELARAISQRDMQLEPKLLRRLESVNSQLGYYRDAWLAVLEKHQTARDWAPQATPPPVELQQRLDGGDESQAQALLTRLLGLRSQVYLSHDLELIAQMRQIQQQLQGPAARLPGLQTFVEQILLLTEQGYLNHLAILERERFLADTLNGLLQTTRETIQAISQSNDANSQRLIWQINGLLLGYVLLSLFLWRR